MNLENDFLLNRDITFLNFGSFGSSPRTIFERYQAYQLELEQEPVQFLTVKGPVYLKNARIALAQYLTCNEDDIVLVTNPSYAVNIVAKSFPLTKKDEVLTTDLEYGACDKTWNYYCEKAGAVLVRQKITLPIISKEEFLSEFFQGVTSKTKLIFINHITSSTGIIFPIKEVIEKARIFGIPVFVDGAHVPGHIDLNLTELGADYYTGACHKWMMAPKGTSFLHVQKKHHSILDPLVISWGFKSELSSGSMLIDHHELQGTRDFSAFCTLPFIVNYLQENDWKAKSKLCKQLVKEHANRFSTLLKTEILAPLNDDFIGQMLSLKIKCKEPAVLKELLYSKYKIEIPIMPHGNGVYIRFSIQIFNTQEDLLLLETALKDIIKQGSLIEL
jgi:isopenicillin-N epimerase